MRNDLYIGAAVSLGLHFAVASFNPGRTPVTPPEKEPEKKYVEWVVKPDDPEVLQTNDDTPPKPRRDVVHPPSQVDVPRIANPGFFTQKVQPTFDTNIDTTAITIPSERTPGTGNSVPIFDPSKLDQQPMAKAQAKPIYPYEAKKDGLEGEVLVDFIVDENGLVHSAYAARSTHREFEEAAVAAVNKWKFRAGKKGGVAVRTHMQVPIVFKLAGDGE